MKKLFLTFILIIISSLAYSQADDNNIDSLIPKNITQDDIIFITSNNQNMKIESEKQETTSANSSDTFIMSNHPITKQEN